MTNKNTVRFLAYALAAFIIICMCTTIFSVFYYIEPRYENNIFLEISPTEHVSKLEIDIEKDQLIIKSECDKFSVNAPKYVKAYTDNDKYVIKEKKHYLRRGIIEVCLTPEVYDSISINAGVGKIDVNSMSTKKFVLKAGVGDINIKNLFVADSFKLNGGVGDIKISDATVDKLNLEAGVGNVSISADVRSDSSIKLGIGNVNLDLLNDDYRFDVDKGIGSVSIFGTNVNGLYGNGNTLIKVNGGIGNIDIH